MQQLSKLSILLFLSLILFSCNEKSKSKEVEVLYQCPMKCEGEKKYSKEGSCPVCGMDILQLHSHSKVEVDNDVISDASIFNLTSEWNTQNGETITLKELKGEVLVMVMIYTSCKAACPRLVADMRGIHTKVNNSKVKYVMISIDPVTDTPERLKAFAIENEMDNNQWLFLQGTVDDVREFSNVLAVKYKKISPMDFSHSNIISVFNQKGELYYQQEGLGVDNKITVGKITELAN